MFLISKPAKRFIEQVIESQSHSEFTYSADGATKDGQYPKGFIVDHNRIRLGSGLATFEAAKLALQNWQHYRFDWIELYRPDDAPAQHQNVGVLARALGLWVLVACRIVYVVDEDQPMRRFAFAYGTLPEHAECGEERFQVEWHASDDSVWYDILAFSRPHQLFAWLSYPYVRHKQKQFAKESMRAMKAALDKALFDVESA